jgi:hypothetical protein
MIRSSFLVLVVTCVACSGGSTGGSGGGGGGSAGGGSGGSGGAGGGCTVSGKTYPINCTYDPGFTQTAPNTPNTIGVTFSGETLGINGLPYIPVAAGDPYFVDGWTVSFEEYIAVVGNIRLNLSPTEDSTWSDMGVQVASKAGPFVLDAHQAAGFLGKDGVEPASGLLLWTALDNGQPFAVGTPYAFSYDIMQAAYPATNVNLATAELADYDLMVKNHWSKFIRGHATNCHSDGTCMGTYNNASDPNAAHAQAQFDAMPSDVYFAFGWDDHGSLINCVNTDNGDGAEDNLANRGISTNNNGTYIAQLTIHTDHIFWDTLEVEGEPLRFDPIAAWAPAGTTLANPFFLNNWTDQKLATKFKDGTPIPDRGPFLTGNNVTFMTDQSGNQVVMNTNGVTTVPDSYPDFMVFSVQSQPHLNAQGLCYVKGQHAADPYFTPNVQPVVQ